MFATTSDCDGSWHVSEASPSETMPIHIGERWVVGLDAAYYTVLSPIVQFLDRGYLETWLKTSRMSS